MGNSGTIIKLLPYVRRPGFETASVIKDYGNFTDYLTNGGVVFCFAVLGIKPKNLYLAGEPSATKLHLHSLKHCS